ncbi:MAG: hypothetical protein WBM83_13930 [Flavobacteriaceae bacterium]
MGIKITLFNSLKVLFIVIMLLTVSCNTSKHVAEVRYERAWKELLKSQAWMDALKKNGPAISENESFYASTDDMGLAEDNTVAIGYSESVFTTKYDVLVTRAYEKIIAEAEIADGRLEREYLNWRAKEEALQEKEDKNFRQQLAVVNNRFKAHRKMLEGLKSWNAFSAYGSDDLDFFKAENAPEVKQMLQNGQGESSVVGFLVYQLADLYHFEE